MMGALKALELNDNERVVGSQAFELNLHVQRNAAVLRPIPVLPESGSLLGFHRLVEVVVGRSGGAHEQDKKVAQCYFLSMKRIILPVLMSAQVPGWRTHENAKHARGVRP